MGLVGGKSASTILTIAQITPKSLRLICIIWDQLCSLFMDCDSPSIMYQILLNVTLAQLCNKLYASKKSLHFIKNKLSCFLRLFYAFST
jgi:hypothetical protein